MSLTPGSPAGPDWTGFFKTLFTIKFIKGSTQHLVSGSKCPECKMQYYSSNNAMVLATLMNYDIKQKEIKSVLAVDGEEGARKAFECKTGSLQNSWEEEEELTGCAWCERINRAVDYWSDVGMTGAHIVLRGGVAV